MSEVILYIYILNKLPCFFSYAQHPPLQLFSWSILILASALPLATSCSSCCSSCHRRLNHNYSGSTSLSVGGVPHARVPTHIRPWTLIGLISSVSLRTRRTIIAWEAARLSSMVGAELHRWHPICSHAEYCDLYHFFLTHYCRVQIAGIRFSRNSYIEGPDVHNSHPAHTSEKKAAFRNCWDAKTPF